MDVGDSLRKAGASVITAHTSRDGLRLAEYPGLSAAVIDFGLNDGDGTMICERLNQRGVPFVLHTGYTHVHEAYRRTAIVRKPAPPEQIVAAVSALLRPGTAD